MNQKTNKFIKNKILYFAIGFTLVMILYAQFILGYYSACFTISETLNSLGLSFGYDSNIVKHFFEIRSTEQLICYGNFIRIWDTIFPMIYFCMYFFWFVYFFKKIKLLLFIPFMHMIIDWIENYIELIMLDEYLTFKIVSDELVSFGSWTSIIKWTISLATYIVIFVGIINKIKFFITIRNKMKRLNYTSVR